MVSSPATDPRTDLDLVRLAEALEQASGWLRRSVWPSDWNAVAMSVLDLLARNGAQRVCALVEHERITQPGMTALVGRLVSAGFARRAADPSDGRATLVSITEAGRGHLRDFQETRVRTVLAGLESLPVAAQQTLSGAAEALVQLTEQPAGAL